MKTKIEWTDYTFNPVKGKCPMACDYCYARRMYDRFRWDPEVRFHHSLRDDVVKLKKPARIFVGSTMELFGPWIEDQWLRDTFQTVRDFPDHTFIFLTKRPDRLIRWHPFPDNAWVGVSAVGRIYFYAACHHLAEIQAGVKLISFEPLLDSMDGYSSINEHFQNAGIGWVIIGQQTPARKKTRPEVQWVKDIVTAADKGKIPVFLKDNLKDMFYHDAVKQDPIPEFMIPEWAGRTSGPCRHPRQEFPRVVKK